MKIFVGFVFTDGPILDLARRGFRFDREELKTDQGYRSFSIFLKNQVELQIREILDEQLYLQTFQVEHFEPFMTSEERPATHREEQNTVFEFRDFLSEAQMEECELKTFLKIRKEFPLWAAWLSCRDFATFAEVSHPDRIFQWRGHTLALIHLGPNCFDLLIGQN